jgi:hypothetical protein
MKKKKLLKPVYIQLKRKPVQYWKKNSCTHVSAGKISVATIPTLIYVTNPTVKDLTEL